jgi:hypothetical protein
MEKKYKCSRVGRFQLEVVGRWWWFGGKTRRGIGMWKCSVLYLRSIGDKQINSRLESRAFHAMVTRSHGSHASVMRNGGSAKPLIATRLLWALFHGEQHKKHNRSEHRLKVALEQKSCNTCIQNQTCLTTRSQAQPIE